MRKKTIDVLFVLILLSLLLLAFLGAWRSGPYFAVSTGQLQLLANGGFERGFRNVDGIGELYVANDWSAWWDETDSRPEYKQATKAVDAQRVRSGTTAQQWFNTYATHTAGVYQALTDVAVGKRVEFSAWIQVFTRNDDRDFRESTGRYYMRIGLDPYGGFDWQSPDVVWSETIAPYDQYYLLQTEAVAESTRVTVWIWGQPEWAFKHNNAYVDDCEAVYVGVTPIPTPTPVATPATIDYDLIRRGLKELLRFVEE